MTKDSKGRGPESEITHGMVKGLPPGLQEVRIRIEELDLEHGPYCMSFPGDEMVLRSSIQQVGVVNPPLVHREGQGSWEVVTGFRRLRSLQTLGHTTCLCRDLSGAGLRPLDLLFLSLYDNLGTRDLNEVEKGMALSRLEARVTREQLQWTCLPLLGLSPRPGVEEVYLALNRAEDSVRRAVAFGFLSMKAFHMLQDWSSADRIEVTRVIHKLKYNMNKQIQFIDILDDIMDTDGIDAVLILADEPATAILEQAADNPPQAAARLLDWLRERRFPSLASAEQAFRQSVASAGLPRGVVVTHPRFFEGTDFRLEIRYRDGRGLRDIVDDLHRNPGLEGLGPQWKGGG